MDGIGRTSPSQGGRRSGMRVTVKGCMGALLFAAFALAALTVQARTSAQAGRDVYEYYCYQCHGYAGDGATLAAQFLQPPPRNFTQLRRADLSRDAMISTVRLGKAGTGMQSFARVLDARQSAAVVDYIRQTFMEGAKLKLGYHTKANGWENHDRHAAAFPFATGSLMLDSTELNASQLAGKRLFLSACVSCHEGRTVQSSPVWASRVVSYPRNPGTCTPCHQSAVAGTLPQDAAHATAPAAGALTTRQQRGRQLFLTNCAFCHAADGTGRNWIGSFLEPHARDLTQGGLREGLTPQRLRHTILEGIPGSSMPAWKGLLSSGDIDALMDYLRVRHGWSNQSGQMKDFAAAPKPAAPGWKRRPPGAP